ncbi:hypothetical protein BC940DRAFT_306485 [Gongronella butleri]|nr:hypothetical protein BC940DRAFT_306485 [Gongronella butleri]
MPSVLVTGVNGFIGAQVADQFLKAGYTVIGAARTAAKAQPALDHFTSVYEEGRFSIVEIPDIQVDGAFDNAVKDVDAIAHVASPTDLGQTLDPYGELINPAVQGTLSILVSAHKFGKNVKSVVVTSSLASVIALKQDPTGNLDPSVIFSFDPAYVHTEKDWNDVAIKIVDESVEKKVLAPASIPYIASKNQAERALWQFRNEHKPTFTLTTICPSFVTGALLPPPNDAKDIGKLSTTADIINYYTGKTTNPQQPTFVPYYVDVEDVARAHVLAVEKSDIADGQRYILASSHAFSDQEIADILRELYPDRHEIIAKGVPGQYAPPYFGLDGSKITRDLGIEYIGFEQTIRNTMKGFDKVL